MNKYAIYTNLALVIFAISGCIGVTRYYYDPLVQSGSKWTMPNEHLHRGNYDTTDLHLVVHTDYEQVHGTNAPEKYFPVFIGVKISNEDCEWNLSEIVMIIDGGRLRPKLNTEWLLADPNYDKKSHVYSIKKINDPIVRGPLDQLQEINLEYVQDRSKIVKFTVIFPDIKCPSKNFDIPSLTLRRGMVDDKKMLSF